jgi:hypothetical protein
MAAMCRNKASEKSDKILYGIQGTCLVHVLEARNIHMKVVLFTPTSK